MTTSQHQQHPSLRINESIGAKSQQWLCDSSSKEMMKPTSLSSKSLKASSSLVSYLINELRTKVVIPRKKPVSSRRTVDCIAKPAYSGKKNAVIPSKQQSSTLVEDVEEEEELEAIGRVDDYVEGGAKNKTEATFNERSHNTIRNLIETEQWNELSRLLISFEGFNQICSYLHSTCSHYSSFHGRRRERRDVVNEASKDEEQRYYPLHVACRLHPPAGIIHGLLTACPKISHSIDATTRQTPLHTATLWGASPEVIHLLLRSYPKAAFMQDIHGKTPLHYSWEGSCLDRRCKCQDARQKIKIVQILCSVTTTTAQEQEENCSSIRDDDGLNALECAQLYDADVKVIGALEIVTKRAGIPLYCGSCRIETSLVARQA